MNRSRYELFGNKNELNLDELVEVPSDLTKEVYKCKVIYSDTIKDVEFRKYTPRIIEHLKLAYCNEIDYSYKYLERNVFDELLRKNNCKDNEDILIIKNNRVTDTSYCNIALFDGQEWHTPKCPLLKGTKRAMLLKEKTIIERDILHEDLKHYQKIILINVMLEFDSAKTNLVKGFIEN